MTEKHILILAGDGIGTEITQEAEKLLHFFNIKTSHGLIGGAAYDETSSPLPSETVEAAKKADSVLLGAVGGAKWEGLDISVRPEKGLLGIRKELELFANLRPAICFEELASSSSLKQDIISGLDILIVRELTGGIYFGEPRGIETAPDGSRKGFNTLVYNDYEVQRIAKVAFELAQTRGKKLCSVDKANVLEATEMWREEVTKVGESYKDVELSHMYVDNASMQLVRDPKQFDVMVTTNMFGDILSDTAAMLTGSLGMLPSASLGDKYSLYEPVHGSAPDIAGQNIANPIATILSVAMMFQYTLNMPKEAEMINQAVRNVLAAGHRTADIHKEGCIKTSTTQMGDLIVAELAGL
jgi:3-isopropylmalate dehydrogenase